MDKGSQKKGLARIEKEYEEEYKEPRNPEGLSIGEYLVLGLVSLLLALVVVTTGLLL